MNRSLEELALRKELLQARSALYRVKIQQEMNAVSKNLQWTKVGVKVITSYPIRSALLGFTFKYLRRRTPRLLAFASGAVMFVKLAGVVNRLFRTRA